MTKREQNLLNAAREILSDFNLYGEVLQVGDNGEYETECAIGRIHAAIQPYNEPSTSTPPESRYGHDLEPEPLAQYLAEYVQQELDDCIDYGEWPGAMVRALKAYQSTENVTIKIERVTE